jgi:hypothetical protein
LNWLEPFVPVANSAEHFGSILPVGVTKGFETRSHSALRFT